MRAHQICEILVSQLGWAFATFLVDCFGGVAPEARRLMTILVRGLQGQRGKNQWREVEALSWQGLSMVVAKEVGRQLSLAALAGQMMEAETDGAPSVHVPYACCRPVKWGRATITV